MSVPLAQRHGPAATELRRWIAGVGVVIGLVATLVLGVGDPVAASGVAIVGLATVWLTIDFRAGAIALIAASVLIPNGVALYFGPTLPLLTFQRLTLVVLVVAALTHAPSGYLATLFAAPRIRLLLAMMLVLGVATALSSDPATSQREFLSERGIGLPIYFAAVWLALGDEASVHRMLRAFVAVAAIVLLLTLVEAGTGRSVVAQLQLLPAEKLDALGYHAELERRAGLPRVQSVFQHPLQLGAYLVAFIPLAVVLRRHATTLWTRAGYTIVVLLGLFALVFTWSRGAWAALLVAALWVGRRGLGRWVLFAAGGTAAVLVLAQLGFLRASTLAYRGWLISGVLHTLVAHYGFGTGPGTFARVVIVHVGGTSERAGVDPLAYSLTMAIEAGPIFVALLWWFVLGFLRDGNRARDHALARGRADTADILTALRVGVLANLILSLFSSSLFGMTTGFFMSLMLVAAIGRAARFELEPARETPESPPPVTSPPQ